MGLKAKKSFEGKGKGFHGHKHEHSVNATEGWDKRYKEMYGKPLSKKKAKLVHAIRPAKNQKIDNSKRANTILKPGTYRANAYIKNPNRYDIQGVDTISKKEKKPKKELVNFGYPIGEIEARNLTEKERKEFGLKKKNEDAQTKTRVTYKVKIQDWDFYYDSEHLAKKEAERLEKIHGSKAEIIKTRSPTYNLGDKWRDDFDYIGMLETGTTVDDSWSNTKLNKLYDSYEDVNYHTPNEFLWKALNAKNDNDKNRFLLQFRSASQKKLDDLKIEDKSPSQLDFVAEGTHSKKEVEEIFREESKKVWKNDSIIDDIDIRVEFYENGKTELAKIGYEKSAGRPRAIGDTLVQTAKHQNLYINKDAMKLSESDFRKLMRHESLHLGYSGHSQDFRRLAKKKDISVTERQLFKQDILIQVKTKDQHRYKTIKTMKSEDDARDWISKNRQSLTKKGIVKTRLVI